MNDDFNRIMMSAVRNQEDAAQLLDKLMVVARPGVVYSEPVTSGDHTVITASEVSVRLGYGYGFGGGTAAAPGDTQVPNAPGESARQQSGGGGGGGGGGMSIARPVAVITIGPE